jgi:hypothetical protein
MTRLRLAAVVLLLSGLTLGAIRDVTPARAPIHVNGYEVLSGDFHVHAFVGDGGLAPWMLQEQAARSGLDVIAITNHNQTLAGRLGRAAAQRSPGPMIIAGEEITGRDFHLIAVGIDRPVNWDQPPGAAIDQVHAQAGVAIAAHPMHGFAAGYDDNAVARLDGVEAAHPDSLPYHRPARLVPDLSCWLERSEAAVVDAIRDGRTVGRCGYGALRGRPELVELLEPYRRALEPPRADRWTTVAMLAVWTSLVALAVLGTRSG